MKRLFVGLIIGLLGSALFAQTDFTGTWNTGKDNTLVKIYEKEGVYVGEIASSDNPKAEIGKQLIKDLKYDDGEWRVKLFAPKKKKWVDAEMELEDDTLKIKIKKGFMKKTIEWERVKSETEVDEANTEEQETDKEE